MAFDAHKNFAYSTVLTAPSPASSGTSLVVQSGDGAKYPAVPFNATVWPTATAPSVANAEVVRVTNISTDTLTITRTQESSSARTIVVGDQIAATMTTKTFTDIESGGNLSTSALANASVTADKLSTGAAYATVATSQTTASSSYTDLATSGPAVTVTIGANGLALVVISADVLNNTNADYVAMAFGISGATTRAAAAPYETFVQMAAASVPEIKLSYSVLVTSLAAGSTTFTAKYKIVLGGTGTFVNREISVIPL